MKLYNFTFLGFSVIFKPANIAYINISTLRPLQPVQEMLFLLKDMQMNELVVAIFMTGSIFVILLYVSLTQQKLEYLLPFI